MSNNCICERILTDLHSDHMESEESSMQEQVYPNNPRAPASQVAATENFKGYSKNHGEENGCSSHSDGSTNDETDTNVTDKGSNSIGINLNNSKTSESSLCGELIRTPLQAELSFEDKVDTSVFECSGQCETKQEENSECIPIAESVETGDDPEIARGGDEHSETLSPHEEIATKCQVEQSEEDDLEEGEVKDRLTPEQSPDHICPLYGRGNCIWGDSCKFLHPNVGDKGNYCMLPRVGVPPAPQGRWNRFQNRFVPYIHRPSFKFPRVVPSVTLRPVPNENNPHFTWERDLEHTKELMINSMRKRIKEREAIFGTERLTWGSTENYKTNEDRYKKNRMLRRYSYKVKNDMYSPCNRKSNVSGISNRAEGEHIRKDRCAQPVRTVRSFFEIDKQGEKQIANTRLSVWNCEMNEHPEMSTVGPRGGQNDGSKSKFERSRRKRFKRTSRSSPSSDSSRSNEPPVKLPARKKFLDEREIAFPPHKIKPEMEKGVPELRRTNYSTKNKYVSSKLFSKSQTPSVASDYFKNGEASSFSYANVQKSSDRETKKPWQKYYGNSLYSAAEYDDHNVKPEPGCSSISSYSMTGSRVSLTQRNSSYPKSVSSFQSLPSKGLRSTETRSSLLLAADCSKRLPTPSPTRCSRSLSTSSASSVSSTTSPSSSESAILSHNKRLVSRGYRDEMARQVQYDKQRCNEKISAGSNAVGHSKPIVPKVGETLFHDAAKNLKFSSKHKNEKQQLPNKASPIAKQENKIENQESEAASRRDVSKLNSEGAKPLSPANNKPSLKFLTREPSSRKDKLLLLLNAVEEAIARKRAVPKAVSK